MNGANAHQIPGRLYPATSMPFSFDAPYVVKGWLRNGQTSMIYGPSNVGKSFFVIDLVYHVATGQSWNGCRTNQGRVLYIATEGQSGFGQRIEALKREKGFPDEFDVHNFLVLPEKVNLLNQEYLEDLCNLLEHDDFSLIVIDTVAMAMGSGSENDNTTIASFLRALEFLRGSSDAHILLVHHTGKEQERGARGHSSLQAAVDTEIALKADNGLVSVNPTKQRDYQKCDKLYFLLESVELGHDSDGDPVTSCVVQYTSKADRPAKLSDAKRTMLKGFETALSGAGFELHGHPDLPSETRAVLKSDWKEAVLDDPRFSKDVQEDSRRRSFARLVKELEADGYVGSDHNDCFWLLKKQDKNTE